MMKDESKNNSEKGAVVGILKIGTKRLFLNVSECFFTLYANLC